MIRIPPQVKSSQEFQSALIRLSIWLFMLIMIGLLASPDAMATVMPVGAWFVVSVLLAPIGYVVQDVVADAMTGQDAVNIAKSFDGELDIGGAANLSTMQTLIAKQGIRKVTVLGSNAPPFQLIAPTRLGRWMVP